MGHTLHMVSVGGNTSFLNYDSPEYHNINGWGKIINKDVYSGEVFVQPKEWREHTPTPTHPWAVGRKLHQLP